MLTDIEFYELRYSGRAAAFLRGFRALYLGVFFNVMIMATVLLAAIKIGGVMLGLTPVQTVLATSLVVVVYTMLGGLSGVLITDFIQFVVAMTGSVLAAVFVVNLPQVGGLGGLFSARGGGGQALDPAGLQRSLAGADGVHHPAGRAVVERMVSRL